MSCLSTLSFIILILLFLISHVTFFLFTHILHCIILLISHVSFYLLASLIMSSITSLINQSSLLSSHCITKTHHLSVCLSVCHVITSTHHSTLTSITSRHHINNTYLSSHHLITCTNLPVSPICHLLTCPCHHSSVNR